jgi:hypothetical protein
VWKLKPKYFSNGVEFPLVGYGLMSLSYWYDNFFNGYAETALMYFTQKKGMEYAHYIRIMDFTSSGSFNPIWLLLSPYSLYGSLHRFSST